MSSLARIALVGLAYYAMCRLGLFAAEAYGGAPPLWPAAGAAFAALHLYGFGLWPLLWVADFLCLLSLYPFTFATMFVAAGHIAAAAVAVFIVRLAKRPGPVQDQARAVLVLALVASSASAFVASLVQAVCLLLDSDPPFFPALWNQLGGFSYWLAWFLAHAAGFVAFAPAIVVWMERERPALEEDRSVESGIALSGMFVLICCLFGLPRFFAAYRLSLGFAVIPFLVWAAFRLDFHVLTLAMAVNAAVAMLAGYQEVKTLSGPAVFPALIQIPVFIGILAAAALILQALLRQSRQTMEALLQSRSEVIEDAEELEQRVEDRVLDLRRLLRERQKTLEELHQAELNAQAMYDNAVQGMFQGTLAGRRISANPACALLLGHDSAEELETVEDFAALHFFRPEDYEAMVAALRDQGMLKNHELQLRRKDGLPIWVLANIRLRVDADGLPFLEGILTDNTAIKLAEEKLRRSEAMLRRIINTTAEGFLLLDKGLVVRDVNQALCRVLGTTREELLGRPLSALLLQAPLPGALPGEAIFPWPDEEKGYETAFVAKSGRAIPMLVHSGALRDAGGGIAAYFAFATDLTEIMAAEALRADVERIMRHDLKTPLNAVINAPQLLMASERFTAEEQDMLRMIEESGYRMLSMINQSLDLYKMERGTYVLTPRPVDMARTARKVCKELQGLAKARDVRTAVHCLGRPATPEDVCVIPGDELSLYSMLANLVKNALEASPEGATVLVSLERDPSLAQLRMAIHNQGAVPEAVRPHFFDKYATSGKEGGTGLGAYSARLIARAHGGSIDFSSSEEHGTTVTMRLPA